MDPIKHILVATDFGDSSNGAVKAATEFARFFGARLTLFHSFEIPTLGLDGSVPFPVDLITPIRQEAERALAEQLLNVKQTIPEARSVLVAGDACHGILDTAEQQKADLIVMGTHGRRGVSRALLGSVAERIVRRAKVPVLTVSESCAERTGTAPAA